MSATYSFHLLPILNIWYLEINTIISSGVIYEIRVVSSYIQFLFYSSLNKVQFLPALALRITFKHLLLQRNSSTSIP